MRRSHILAGLIGAVALSGSLACNAILGIEEIAETDDAGATGGNRGSERDGSAGESSVRPTEAGPLRDQDLREANAGGRAEVGPPDGEPRLGDAAPSPADARDAAPLTPEAAPPADAPTRSDGPGPQPIRDAGPDTAPATPEASPQVGPDDGGTVETRTGEPITVAGRVIDSWRVPIPTALVAIGDMVVATNENGEFHIDGVAPPYTLYLRASEGAAWVFEDLQVAHPTLQTSVPVGSPWRADVEWKVTQGNFSNRALGQWVFASNDGAYSAYDTISDNSSGSFDWYSTASRVTGTFHLLRTERTVGLDNVERYSAYTSAPGALDRDTTMSLAFNLTGAGALDMTTLRVVPDVAVDQVRVNVHFDANAVVNVIQDDNPNPQRDYNVPKHAGWTYSVAARKGDDSFTSSLGMASKQGLTGDALQVSLTLPTPAALVTPPPGSAAVGPNTPFRWTGQPGVNIVWLVFNDLTTWVRIVTTRKTITIPTLPPEFGMSTPRNAESYWFVATPGTYAKTDDAVGPDGYAMAYSTGIGRNGPEYRDGTLSYSSLSTFTTSP